MIQNPTMAAYPFLAEMAASTYYPDVPVQHGIALLHALCERIEAEQPADLDALYVITNETTEQFNELQDEFADAGSEIETVARECICVDILTIAQAYGFADADIEELTAERDF